MSGTFRIVSHTADVALSLRASTEGELLHALGRGLVRLIAGPRFGKAKARQGWTGFAHGRMPAESLEALLVKWANEMICAFDTDGLLWIPGDVPVVTGSDETGWVAEAWLALYAARERGLEQFHDLKAATWHGLKVTRRNGILRARLVLDT